MREMTPDQLDEWRWEEAVKRNPGTGQYGYAPIVVSEYRRLVRENAHPDFLTVEARAIVAAKFPEAHPANEWALVQVAYEGLRRGVELGREISA